MDSPARSDVPPLPSIEDASMASVTTAAPTRRPTLLPAFEPFSSSPALPRPVKRKFDDTLDREARKSYPTPIPTSSTGILPSSPPARRTRPGLQRAVSSLSERAPLNDVPALEPPANGDPLLMGRSSNSSDYQLPSHRNISRVHVRACYVLPSAEHPRGALEVECLGWNGIKVHCRGDVIDLAKGDTYTWDKFDQSLLLDVQDTRVMLGWPKDILRDPPSADPGSPWLAESPSKPPAAFDSSPPMILPGGPTSPISPRRALDFGATFSSTFQDDGEDEGLVKIYEDRRADEDAPHDPSPAPGTPTPTPAVLAVSDLLKQSQQTSASSDLEELSEHDEENDPIVHSFYVGDNLMSRFESFKPTSPQSFKNTSPERKRKPLKGSANSPGRSFSARNMPNPSPIKNHVINQLAFSRIHSLPLSTIHSNLPAELRGAMAKPSDTENRWVLTTSELKTILDDIPCVGEISRSGKDAAGKLLESEFYYVPEMDTDTNRRDTVTLSLGKTSIRAARKQHKVGRNSYMSPEFNMLTGRDSNTTGSAHGTKSISSWPFVL